MTINHRIVSAVTPVIAVCKPEIYLPPDDPEKISELFCTFEVDADPICGDDRPLFTVYSCVVHFFAPYESPEQASVNTLSLRLDLAEAISQADGFSVPDVEDLSDAFGQHFAFRFQAV